MMFQWIGPTPPPAAVREFEEILPGAADRILTLAEIQVEHRHDLERRTNDSMIKIEERGQIIGATIATLAIIIGGLLIYTDHDGFGFAMIVAAIGGLLGAAVFSRRSQVRELSQRRTELDQMAEEDPAIDGGAETSE